MTGLKELYIMNYTEGHDADFLHLILKKCLGLEYLYVFTDVLDFIPENQLSLKYLCGCLRAKPLLSIIEKSPALEGLEIDFEYRQNPYSIEDSVEVLPILLMELPFGLKWLKIELDYEVELDYVSSLFCSEAMKTLQVLEIYLMVLPVFDIPILSAPELVKFEYRDSNAIPDQILRSLAMYSTKLKEVRLSVPDRTGGQAVYFPLRGLEKVRISGSSDELTEILCRQNRDLQSLELLPDTHLTAVSMTRLATLEHLTNIKVYNTHRFCTPTSLLCFLRNRASRPKNLELFVSYIHSEDPQEMVDLKQETETRRWFFHFHKLLCKLLWYQNPRRSRGY